MTATARLRRPTRGTAVTVSLYVEHEDGTEHEYEIECSVTAGSPGRTYGDPGSCYPPEPPEVEVVSVRDGLGELGALDADRLVGEHLEEIEEKAIEAAGDACEPDPDDERDRRMDDDYDARSER